MRIATTCLVFSLLLFVTSAHADSFGSGANTFDIEFVVIGNPGNVADDISANPDFAGSVPYTYRIGKYEISEQMIGKATAEGGLGILKDTRGPDKPATSVSWNEAARFINWLNTSAGSMPAYKFALQPGDVGYDANANIELWTIGDAGYNPNNKYRNSQAKYFLPSVDEWYKAAYFDPTGGVYYDYPTSSNSAPDGIDFAGDTTFDAVFIDGGLNPGPNDITNVGVLSPYGTAGQGGNVSEWEETYFHPVNDLNTSARGLRGGGVDSFSSFLLASDRGWAFPTVQGSVIGFRVASIPEPTSTGDFDNDGDVDGRDFLIWQRGESPNPLSPQDLAVWQTNYGIGSLSAVSTVPEPTGLFLLSLGAFGLLVRRLHIR